MEEAVAESESTLAYQHASGEIHTARSPEEAILLCTHLGQIVMEEGGEEKARRMIKLYAIGAEKIAKEAEETEEVDEIEQQEEAPQPEEKTGEPKQGELLDSKKVSREIEQPAEAAAPGQEIVTPTISAARVDSADNYLNESVVARSAAIVSESQHERVEIVAAARPTLENTKDIYETTARAIELKSLDQTGPSVAKAPVASTKKEITRQTIIIEKPAERPVATLKALPETDRVDSPHTAERDPNNSEDSVIGDGEDEDLVPHFESEYDTESAETISVEAELDETMAEDSEIAEPDAFDEFQQMSDKQSMEAFYEGEETGEEFVLPIPEAHNFELPEYMTITPEAIPELAVPVEQLEQAVQELAERIGKIEAEESELVHQILNEIVLKVEEAHSVVESGAENQEDNTEKIEETQEELKELFVQLFEGVGIEYTEEIIDSFVKLILKQEVPELILKAEPEDETSAVHDQGTHEIIKQILAAITSTKKVALHAYRIGQSAVRLYSQQLATA